MTTRTVLVTGGDEAARDALAAEVAARGDRCVRVVAGTGYERLDEDAHRVEPGSREAHERLIRDLSDRAALPDPYRQFIGIWSDAAWNPQLCAALVVESVQPDGTASILYVFGPMGSNTRRAGGVLHGTGVIRDGELRFQNSDGTQFAFRPLYADLDGRLTTPQGQSYQAVFKKTL